jgi:hypothetical protein
VSPYGKFEVITMVQNDENNLGYVNMDPEKLQ